MCPASPDTIISKMSQETPCIIHAPTSSIPNHLSEMQGLDE